jgi:hypothetical protein
VKSRAQAWTITVCLLAAMAVIIGLRTRSANAQSNDQSARRVAVVQPQPHLSTVSLRSATVPAPMLLDGEAVPAQRAASPGKRRANSDLPVVEEFVLTPPNPALKIYKTQLSVKFPGLAAEGLAAAIPLTLGNQNVVLRRSANDPAVYTAAVDFDWKTFTREQQQRKDLADTGREIPVFEGHQFVRMDRIHFVDPDEIRTAVESHQSIQFTPQILEGTGFTIQPAQELMIVAPSVVEDPARTWDPCTSVGTPTGAWTVGTLMTALANGRVDPRTMVENWLNNWTNNNLVINTFKVNPRPGMPSKLLNTWPRIAGKLDLVNAPMRLNAIVNRIDLGQTGGTPGGGELRFIFGVTSPCPHGLGRGGEATPQLFDVIFEYTVPHVSGCSQVQSWANQWHALDNDPNFNRDLQRITDQVVTISAGASANLNRIRTNETLLSDSTTPPGQGWEMREFLFSSGVLSETTVAETPQGDPYTTDWNALTCAPYTQACNAALLNTWINANQSIITFPGFYTLPNSFAGAPFLGASAFQPVSPPGSIWWLTRGQIGANTRATFSANTCNACHGAETATANEQVMNRIKGQQATLSGFLVGCNGNHGSACSVSQLCPLTAPCVETILNPDDPGPPETWGDILRRTGVLSNILNGCSSDGLLQGLVLHRISFVH